MQRVPGGAKYIKNIENNGAIYIDADVEKTRVVNFCFYPDMHSPYRLGEGYATVTGIWNDPRFEDPHPMRREDLNYFHQKVLAELEDFDNVGFDFRHPLKSMGERNSRRYWKPAILRDLETYYQNALSRLAMST